MTKALFLDRDGVINVEKNYVHKIADFQFAAGIFEVLSAFQAKGYLLVVITNQAGIGRGLYSETDFKVLTDWMLGEFAKNNIVITAVYYSPFHPEFGVGKYKSDDVSRKPRPGMILQARQEYDIQLEHSILVGDKESDIEAGRNAGVGCNVLLNCRAVQSGGAKQADFVIADILELPGILEFKETSA